MDKKNIDFSEKFISVSMKLHNLCDALDRLTEARIKHSCHIEFCLELMRRGAMGDEVAVDALSYAIPLAARQARLSIAARPKWKKLMDDIQFERDRISAMRVLTYQALRPFAMKEFE